MITIRNGTEQLVIDAVVRPLWAVAEQLLGAGTIVPCMGEDATGMTDGPCFISDDSVENLMSHMGDTATWELESAIGPIVISHGHGVNAASANGVQL